LQGGYKASGLPKLSTSNVLVCSRGGGGGMVQVRMVVLKVLWNHGIAAETMLVHSPNLHDQFSYAQERNIPYLVIINKEVWEANQMVRVKCLGSKGVEEDVAVVEVGRWLSGAISGGGGGGDGGGGGGEEQGRESRRGRRREER